MNKFSLHSGFQFNIQNNFKIFLFLGICTIPPGYSSCPQSYKGNYRICYLYQQHPLPVCWCWWSTFTETEVVPVLWLCHFNSLSCFIFWIWPSTTGRQVSYKLKWSCVNLICHSLDAYYNFSWIWQENCFYCTLIMVYVDMFQCEMSYMY
jgi:hypothetical protein